MQDFSRDVAVVVDFIGESDYHSAFEKLRHSLQMKGFVTPNDDLAFSLELELLNLELLRRKCRGSFTSVPTQCHRGVDLLIGLGQTIPALSEAAKRRLHGRIRKGLVEGLWPLQHEFAVAANLSKRGYDLFFHDLEEDGGYDFLATKDHSKFEIETKAVSLFTGWPIKPENSDKLLVEIKNHFHWTDPKTIPVLSLTLQGNLEADRDYLRTLVAAFCEVAAKRETLQSNGATIRFIGTIPNLEPVKLAAAVKAHSALRKTMVMFNIGKNRLVLEMSSHRPISLEKKIIKTINEASRDQLTGTRPAVIWTHIAFGDDARFRQLSTSEHGKTCILDGIAFAALSQKRDHLTQLMFSGGTPFLSKDLNAARSSYSVAVYDSPATRFEAAFLFPNGRKKKEMNARTLA